VKKIAEKFNHLSRVHQRHRRQTDRHTTDNRRTAIAYSERNVVRSLKKDETDSRTLAGRGQRNYARITR